MKTSKSITISACLFVVFALLLIGLPEKSYSGMAFSLGCCTADDQCLGCGEEGNRCSVTQGTCLQELGGTFFQGGDFCFQGQSGASCVNTQGTPGCCVIEPGSCEDDVVITSCPGDRWFLDTECSEVPICTEVISRNVPALSVWGLASIAVILGAVGFFVLKRRKAVA